MPMVMRRILIPEHTSLAPPCPGSAIFDFHGDTMGTTWSVRVVAEPYRHTNWQHELKQGIQHELDTVVAQMSHWLADSDLSRFNRAAAGTWQTLPGAFFEVLTYALRVAEDSGSAYDPAAGILVNLWGFGPVRRYNESGFHLPGSESVRAAHHQSGWQRLSVDTKERRIRQPGGVQLDLSAVAKGYGVDCVARYLERCGLAHYLVEVGGELRGAGIKPDEMPWWVALERPPSESQSPTQNTAVETIVALHGLAIATSGDYRRSYTSDGVRIAHTVDPRTGYPIRNNVASVTVLHPSCMAADALSTALTVLGVADGMIFAEEHRLAARFLVRNDRGFIEYTSRAFEAMLQ